MRAPSRVPSLRPIRALARHGLRLHMLPSVGLSALVGMAMLALTGDATAQRPAQTTHISTPTANPDDPVTFVADSVEYDSDRSSVTARGQVEAWQGEQVLRADMITFDRATGVVAASGNVTLLQPDGQVMFADYAELAGGMRDGVLKGIRSRLPENARLAANGARRTAGVINEMSRLVYTTCNDCKDHPERAPLWQIRAFSATQDTENKRIEYRDAEVDVLGIPVMYLPFFWHADPSVKRASGFLVPNLGTAGHVGTFLAQPYYWVIDDQSDALITPQITQKFGPQLAGEYRRSVNNGRMTVNLSAANYDRKFQWQVAAKGEFNYNDQWRYGFDINRVSSVTYMRDFHLPGLGTYQRSEIYAEGFGQGAYARIDARSYQSLTTRVSQGLLPQVTPRFLYSYVGQPDSLGGTTSFDFNSFNIIRSTGTNTRRAAASLDWQRPATGRFGELYKLIMHLDTAGYSASRLSDGPSYATQSGIQTAYGQPTVALNLRWPWQRSTPASGTQIIEPILQVAAGTPTGFRIQRLIPNEDSLDFEFSDMNLFALNRFPGLDRHEGGVRAAAALRGAWYFPSGASLDGFVGQSWRARKDDTFPINSGLEDRVSDIVAKAAVTPVPWFDLVARGRFGHRDFRVRMADLTGYAGTDRLRVSAGYLYSTANPYLWWDTPASAQSNVIPFVKRNEITAGVSTGWDKWRFAANARRDIATGKTVGSGVSGTYEDECVILDLRWSRRYTSFAGDKGESMFLIQVTLKTVGDFGLHAF